MARDIGQILDLLHEAGLAENTLFVAMGDNGLMHELSLLGPHAGILPDGTGDCLERVPGCPPVTPG
jgi:arylsulfatase A-like enzyme